MYKTPLPQANRESHNFTAKATQMPGTECAIPTSVTFKGHSIIYIQMAWHAICYTMLLKLL